MLYTLGHRESYEMYFREQEHPQKMGRGPHPHSPGEEYRGGSVFENFGDALAACPPGYFPYGLETDLANTYTVDGSRHLIDHALLRRLDEQGHPIA
jgi:hypothetical protein